MSTFMWICLAAFGCSVLHALVLTGWKDAFGKAWRPDAAPAKPQEQLVSLIVPARDAAETLTPLLQDLHAQAWPKELLEVLVVDDGSTDGTADLVRSMMRTWPHVQLLTATGTGKKSAITQGVAVARGEWIILTDADARCGPNRVRRIMAQVERTSPDLLLMPVEMRSTGGILETLQADEQAALLGAAAGMALQGQPLLANGANMAFRRSTFQSVGGYEGDKWASGDDVFLLRRMLKEGKRVDYLLHPDVLVTVEAEKGFRAFWRQRLRWAGKMRGVGGAGAWTALAALLLPWFLLYVTTAFSLGDWMAQSPGACLMLLATAWLLWLLPVLALLREVRRFLKAAGSMEHHRAAPITGLLSYLAFHVYAPVVALASLVVRPKWKGRRV